MTVPAAQAVPERAHRRHEPRAANAVWRPEESDGQAAGRIVHGVLGGHDLLSNHRWRAERQQAVVGAVIRDLVSAGEQLTSDVAIPRHGPAKDEECRPVATACEVLADTWCVAWIGAVVEGQRKLPFDAARASRAAEDGGLSAERADEVCAAGENSRCRQSRSGSQPLVGGETEADDPGGDATAGEPGSVLIHCQAAAARARAVARLRQRSSP